MGEQLGRRRDDGNDDDALARGLGWFSLALGVAGLSAPRTMSEAIGVHDHPALMRGVGAREIACGIGILSRDRPAPWLWARVGGDIMDLGLLTTALATDSTRRDRTAAATAAIGLITALDVVAAARTSTKRHAAEPDTGEARD